MAAYEGTTICYITDSNQLIINDSTPFQTLFNNSIDSLDIEKSYTVKEFASIHGKSEARIKKMCLEGKLRAKKINNVWFILQDTYPVDGRIKTGDYIKE